MAYANLIDINCATKEEFFQRFRDFICKRNGTYNYSTTGIGWTLHDAVYATDENNCVINDYFVIYSAGEGTEEDLYFKITWTSGYFKVEGYQSWDSAAHTGSSIKYNATQNFALAETGATYIIWLYGDLDAAVLVADLVTDQCNAVQFGKLDPGWENHSETIAHCSGTLTAGSDVSITVDAAPANWAVGKEIFIRTTHNNVMGTVKMEKITIKTLAGNVLTADLVNSYTANSALSDFVGYSCAQSSSLGAALYTVISMAGTFNQTTNPVQLGLTTGSFDPGPYEDRFFLLEMVYHSASGLEGKSKHLRRVPTFVAGWAVGDVLQEDDGTQWRAFKNSYNIYVAVKEV